MQTEQQPRQTNAQTLLRGQGAIIWSHTPIPFAADLLRFYFINILWCFYVNSNVRYKNCNMKCNKLFSHLWQIGRRINIYFSTWKMRFEQNQNDQHSRRLYLNFSLISFRIHFCGLQPRFGFVCVCSFFFSFVRSFSLFHQFSLVNHFECVCVSQSDHTNYCFHNVAAIQ